MESAQVFQEYAHPLKGDWPDCVEINNWIKEDSHTENVRNYEKS
ncbi:hypothetical protein QRD02_04275 [Aequorivita sp. SDUM287046]|uniref:Uncharacterized protein n=1 Tax=Aequorivita aurantiaca TaxID=3053356 RepID=A0ABT8DE69_9FLAO|nr:hypothetical protein [Aequorivita aurantiaca]MDN3723587.1 hypothetical protein [Aequorivita aurantiaca]